MGRVKAAKEKAEGDGGGQVCSGKGIVNLGNTCFFNSVMQNLVRTTQFRERVLKACGEDGEEAEDDDHLFDDVGPLFQELGRFFKAMTGVYTIKSSNVKPSSLFAELIRQSPRYKGFQQHDAQELLWTVLDLIRTEERKRIIAEGEAATVEAGGSAAAEEDIAGAGKKERRRERFAKPPRTLVDDVFAGKCRNAVTCLLCGTESVSWEPVVDLFVPIPERFHRQDPKGEAAGKRVSLCGSQRQPRQLARASALRRLIATSCMTLELRVPMQGKETRLEKKKKGKGEKGGEDDAPAFEDLSKRQRKELMQVVAQPRTGSVALLASGAVVCAFGALRSSSGARAGQGQGAGRLCCGEAQCQGRSLVG